MKSKSFMLMILSMGFGLIAAIGISQVMRTSKANNQPVTKMGPVLVAADHLDMKALLTEENVKIENWPVAIIPENAANSYEDIADMVTRMRMSKGMPIVKSAIIDKKKASIISIPEGFKVVAIKVDSGDMIGGLLNPGDKIDVMGYFKRRVRGETQNITRTFLKGLRVFSVNSKMQAADDRQEASARSAIVGVLVTEKQSEEIFFVQKTGQIKLVLRGESTEGDDDVEDINDILALDEDEPEEDDLSIEEPFEMPAFAPKTEMIMWVGNSAQKFSFEQGDLPQLTGQTQNTMPQMPGAAPAAGGPQTPPQPPQLPTPGSEANQEDPAGFGDIDRNLEQDQYRGE
jgi:pilus assembly protein CpaB